MAAFRDPSVRAVMATIGGDDQLTVLPHLEPEVFAANPKPFFGYSDNTNLLNFLTYAGVQGRHGGSVMVHLARGLALHPITLASLRASLFEGGDHELPAAERYADHPYPWADPANLEREAWSRPAEPWSWHGRAETVRGRLWGGNVEILSWTLQVGRYVQEAERYSGCVLFLETSEELPSATEVFRLARNLGERGILGVVSALVVARPAAQGFGAIVSDAEVATYARAQRESILRALDTYNPGVPAVFGVEAGHTDPQVILPYGGEVTVDAVARRVIAHYG
jgi:muramoyltetrapeptide carboxypeptidase LdcA involved in peptidoglycan recycling